MELARGCLGALLILLGVVFALSSLCFGGFFVLGVADTFAYGWSGELAMLLILGVTMGALAWGAFGWGRRLVKSARTGGDTARDQP